MYVQAPVSADREDRTASGGGGWGEGSSSGFAPPETARPSAAAPNATTASSNGHRKRRPSEGRSTDGQQLPLTHHTYISGGGRPFDSHHHGGDTSSDGVDNSSERSSDAETVTHRLKRKGIEKDAFVTDDGSFGDGQEQEPKLLKKKKKKKKAKVAAVDPPPPVLTPQQREAAQRREASQRVRAFFSNTAPSASTVVGGGIGGGAAGTLPMPSLRDRLGASPYLERTAPPRGGGGRGSTSLRLVAVMDEERELLRTLRSLRARRRGLRAGGATEGSDGGDEVEKGGGAEATPCTYRNSGNSTAPPRSLPPLINGGSAHPQTAEQGGTNKGGGPNKGKTNAKKAKSPTPDEGASAAASTRLRSRLGLPPHSTSTSQKLGNNGNDNDVEGADDDKVAPPPTPAEAAERALLAMDEEAAREDAVAVEHRRWRQIMAFAADSSAAAAAATGSSVPSPTAAPPSRGCPTAHSELPARSPKQQSPASSPKAASATPNGTTATDFDSVEGVGAIAAAANNTNNSNSRRESLSVPIAEPLVRAQLEEEAARNALYARLWTDRRRFLRREAAAMAIAGKAVTEAYEKRLAEEAEAKAREHRRAVLSQRKQLWIALERLEAAEGAARFRVDMTEFRTFLSLSLAHTEALTRVHEDALRRRLQCDADDRAEMTYVTEPDAYRADVVAPEDAERRVLFAAFIEGGWRILRMLQARARAELETYEAERRRPTAQLALLRQLDAFEDFLQTEAQPGRRREVVAEEAAGWAFIEMELRKADLARKKAARETVNSVLSEVADTKRRRVVLAAPMARLVASVAMRAVERALMEDASAAELVRPLLERVAEGAPLRRLLRTAEDDEDDADDGNAHLLPSGTDSSFLLSANKKDCSGSSRARRPMSARAQLVEEIVASEAMMAEARADAAASPCPEGISLASASAPCSPSPAASPPSPSTTDQQQSDDALVVEDGGAGGVEKEVAHEGIGVVDAEASDSAPLPQPSPAEDRRVAQRFVDRLVAAYASALATKHEAADEVRSQRLAAASADYAALLEFAADDDDTDDGEYGAEHGERPQAEERHSAGGAALLMSLSHSTSSRTLASPRPTAATAANTCNTQLVAASSCNGVTEAARAKGTFIEDGDDMRSLSADIVAAAVASAASRSLDGSPEPEPEPEL